MGKYEDMERIAALREQGVLSEEEFQREKDRILRGPLPGFSKLSQGEPLFGMKEETYCITMHLSQLLSFFPPLTPVGIAIPIGLWFFGKNTNEKVDRTGRIIINWFITVSILAFVSFLLVHFFIGVPLLLALLGCGLVFPIIAAAKMSEGQVWNYPLNIDFLGVFGMKGEKSALDNLFLHPGKDAPKSPNPKKEKKAAESETHFHRDKYDTGLDGKKYDM